MPSLTRRVPFGLIALGLYALSLLLPAIVVIHKPLFSGASRDELMFGFQCLLIGWFTPSWYANIALGLAAIALMYHRPRLAAAFSIVAIGLALAMFIHVNTLIRGPHVGYVVWLASMILALIASCDAAIRHRGARYDDASVA